MRLLTKLELDKLIRRKYLLLGGLLLLGVLLIYVFFLLHELIPHLSSGNC